MKYLVAIILMSAFSYNIHAQSCGQVNDFTYSVTNNSNGSKTYRFYVTVQSTGEKKRSVKVTIKCATHTFVSNRCEETRSNPKIIFYGPYTVNACDNDINLTWTGYSNDECESSPCTPLQTYSPLPVELKEFKAALNNKTAVLKWSTASEKNNEKFLIERSNDGVEYEAIGEVSGNETSDAIINYDFTDKTPNYGINYYRLKQVDFDGNFEYSPIISLEINPVNEVALFPTNFNTNLNVSLPADIIEEPVNFSIFNMQGTMVFESTLIGNNTHNISLPNLQSGQYIVHIETGIFAKTAMIIKN